LATGTRVWLRQSRRLGRWHAPEDRADQRRAFEQPCKMHGGAGGRAKCTVALVAGTTCRRQARVALDSAAFSSRKLSISTAPSVVAIGNSRVRATWHGWHVRGGTCQTPRRSTGTRSPRYRCGRLAAAEAACLRRTGTRPAGVDQPVLIPVRFGVTSSMTPRAAGSG
jgi:hypothetical protein